MYCFFFNLTHEILKCLSSFEHFCLVLIILSIFNNVCLVFRIVVLFWNTLCNLENICFFCNDFISFLFLLDFVYFFRFHPGFFLVLKSFSRFTNFFYVFKYYFSFGNIFPVVSLQMRLLSNIDREGGGGFPCEVQQQIWSRSVQPF